MDGALQELLVKWLPYVITAMGAFSLSVLFLAYTLWKYGKEIQKLNRFETIVKLAYFADKNEDAAKAFGHAAVASDRMRKTTEEFRTDLESLRDFMKDVQEKLSEYNADKITEERLDNTDQPLSAQNGQSYPQSGHPQTVQQLYGDMLAEWQLFLDAFRKRLEEAKIAPNLRRIGRMTYDLADRRRKNPLPLETAELITALHAQYKRYVRLQTTKSDWLTKEVHDAFVQLVRTSIQELQKPPIQQSSSASGSANGKVPEEQAGLH